MTDSRKLMQCRDITEPDNRLLDFCHAVNDTLQTVPSAGTEDKIDRIIVQCLDEVRQPVFIGDGLPEYRMAPMLGEHSEEVLRSLGYGDEELKALHESGVYATWDDLKAQHGG